MMAGPNTPHPNLPPQGGKERSSPGSRPALVFGGGYGADRRRSGADTSQTGRQYITDLVRAWCEYGTHLSRCRSDWASNAQWSAFGRRRAKAAPFKYISVWYPSLAAQGQAVRTHMELVPKGGDRTSDHRRSRPQARRSAQRRRTFRDFFSRRLRRGWPFGRRDRHGAGLRRRRGGSRPGGLPSGTAESARATGPMPRVGRHVRWTGPRPRGLTRRPQGLESAP